MGWLTVSEAAERIGVSVDVVRRLCARKKLHCEQDGPGTWRRISQSSVTEYVLHNTSDPLPVEEASRLQEAAESALSAYAHIGLVRSFLQGVREKHQEAIRYEITKLQYALEKEDGQSQ